MLAACPHDIALLPALLIMTLGSRATGRELFPHTRGGRCRSSAAQDNRFQDVHNRRDEWSVSGADTPHRLVFSGVYELPIGRGRAIAGVSIDGYATWRGEPV